MENNIELTHEEFQQILSKGFKKLIKKRIKQNISMSFSVNNKIITLEPFQLCDLLTKGTDYLNSFIISP